MKISAVILFLFLFAGNLAAGQYDIKQMTPEIQQALQGRQARYNSLQDMKDEGKIGENNQGYIEEIGGASGLDYMVQSENQDRGTLYRAIVQQNNLPDSGLAQVEAAFADVQREKARSGNSIQMSSGEWVKKE